MSNVLVEEQDLYDIADAIRDKNGSNQSYYPSEMAQAIEDIPTDGAGKYNVLCFTADKENSSVYIKCHKDLEIKLQYSYDNESWSNWSSTLNGNDDVFSTITLTNIGDKVYVRGNNATMGISNSVYSQFTMTGKITASGDLQSLLTYDCSYKGVLSYCYYYIFSNCSALTTAPELSATTLGNFCYAYAFQSCTSLTIAPELPATILAQSCYSGMFSSCTKLTTAPAILPATTLAISCYNNMFQNCTSLTITPELPATTLVSSCYYGMFQGCKSLTTAPELPATILSDSCYYFMFTNCSALTTTPELPATILASYCYGYMFQNCTSLTTASELPATMLVSSCYYYMFGGCTSLTTAPELPATTLVSSCYSYMFYGCTSLNKIVTCAIEWNTSYSQNWVSNVASSGVFYKPSSTTIATGTNGIPSGWTTKEIVSITENEGTIEMSVNIQGATIYYTDDGTMPTTESNIYVNPITIGDYDSKKFIAKYYYNGELSPYSVYEYSNYCCFEALATTSLSKSGSYLEFSKNNKTSWSTTIPSSLSTGDKLYIRRINDFSSNNNYITSSSGKLKVSGCYSSLVRTNINEKDAPSWWSSSFSRILRGAGFYDCSELKMDLNNNKTYTYYQAFYQCTGLVYSPKVLHTTVSDHCYYQMFYGCTSLTTAPELPATILSDSCYGYMFQNCISLTTAPELPATTLASTCYYGMFYYCTSLTTAPELPATDLTTYCYREMFSSCNKLNYIKVLATSWNISNTQNWVSNVSKQGTFVKPTNTSITSGSSGIPSGWTVQNI